MVERARHDPAPGLKSLCQRPPIGPVLPVSSVYNCLSVNNLAFWSHHGMEEVIGSIPIRSTNYFNHLAPPPFRDFVASLSQTPKPLHGQASFPAYRRVRNQPLSSFALAVEQVVVLRREVLRASPTAFAAPALLCRCPSTRHGSR